ncbi:DUF1329 domain-containing protein [Seongchinamella sediminis]|uniref:DUF1329 domain-containing protein n=1 Tax=Seongchinamella sediminis TaxID=2283635 RepID=A0A3L7DYZ2_9GAMM|nr:DUF1329 domain-containing protein [Seongchinamella sediminis]RLQ21353.1 DUF1329 domain-containing protein [Seongchinamella sediminis]
MQQHKRPIVAGLASVFLSAGFAHAQLSEEQANRLGTELHPFGAKIEGNADGSIPAWEPKWLGLPPGLDYAGPGETRPDPYKDDKPVVTITAANYKEHAEHLGEGQKAMFERYPDYRIVVYPTHRDFQVDKVTAARTKWNVPNTVVANGVDTLKNYNGGVAFPIHGDKPEHLLWNMRTTACYESYHVAYDGYGVFANGERAHDAVDFYQSNPFNNPENPVGTTEETVGDRIVWTFSTRIAPPRKKGEMTVVQDPMDFKANSRNAWTYDPGTRRVRKAPAIGYDNPDGPGGLQTIDDHKGFNGAFDRFNYTYLGLQEIYVPFHNYQFNNKHNGTLDDRLTLHHLNPDFVRFEKRRVHVVQGDLAEGKRHAYKKRRWYIEDDTWNPVMSENFDGRDNLWRVGYFLSDYNYDSECYEKHTQVFHDLPSGAYVSNFITIDRKETDHSIDYLDKDYFTPANLRKMAKR